MSALSYKMLFRKGGTASSILAIALLVAIPASMNSIINHINSQTEALGGLVNIGGTYLILSGNSSSITDSKIDVELASIVGSITEIKHALPQKVFKATLTKNTTNRAVLIRGIEDVSGFLGLRGAYVNGTTAKGEMEVNVGEVLARLTSINMGDEVNLTVGNKLLKVKVVGIVKTLTQSDSEIIAPMGLANRLIGAEGKLSLIEFTLKDGVKEEALQGLIKLLPECVKIVRVQQTKTFIQDINTQTLTFLNQWSLAVYAVVVASSYVVATRLTTESSYELAMLKALGAKGKLIFTLVLTHTATMALLGSILGLAIGVAGAQMASTIARWMLTSLDLAPFLMVNQALRILLLTLASSILGCIYPSLKASHKSYAELLL